MDSDYDEILSTDSDEDEILVMDSDDEELLAVLLEEESAEVAEGEEHLQILASLAQLYMQTANQKCGGSATGRMKCKAIQRIEGYCIFYADYFPDQPLHGENVFRRRFRMS